MPSPAPSLLERVGLHRPELRAWAMYDWANSAFWLTVLQTLPIYFATVVSAGVPVAVSTARYAWATSAALALVALLSPVLGAMADYSAAKKRMLGLFLAIGVPPTAALFFVGPGQWKLCLWLYAAGNIGVAGTLVFYDALLPHVARREELDRVSTSGFALGYLGSGLLFTLNVAWIVWPGRFGIASEAAAMRLSLLSAAVWWLVFSLPLLTRVREPARRLEPGERSDGVAFVVGLRRLLATFRALREHRQAFLFLLAFLIYNDGVNTIIRMAALYGHEIGVATDVLIASILLAQFVGVPCSLLFGRLATRIGARRAIFLALAVYLVITAVAYRAHTAGHFLLLAILVGTVQGGIQALSRSLFATLVPRHRSAEFFGFFGVFEKFSGVFGPTLFATVVAATGHGRSAVLAVGAFFVIGGALLSRVDVAAGQRAAAEQT
jgi:MFS transporter, UMF1 family